MRLIPVLLLLFLAGCGSPAYALRGSAGVTVQTTALRPDPRPCTDQFVTYSLDHVTAVQDGVVEMFEANGAGVAVGDLDGDGDLDLLFGNHDGPDSLFWNEGGLAFRRQDFSTGKTRDVKLVDVDGDGRLDVVLTRSTGALNYFHNQGDGEFSRLTLPGVSAPAYALNWADLDGDGDLDLVTGSYDAGLLTDRGNEYIVGSGHRGIVYYENRAGRFLPQSLATEAQALSILFPDLNGDGQPDILVGNDFNVPDMVWLRAGDGWTPAEPLVSTTHSTMSLDQGDINNDGQMEIFAADMKPYPGEATGAWMPMMEAMMEGMVQEQMAADRQIMENTLLMAGEDDLYWNLAPDWGVHGTGWTWTSKFGDLDNDGYLDLYAVNGMIEKEIFAHLDGHELVEKNQVFRNAHGMRFEAMPGWELGSLGSGRGMTMADLDEDGDLDIVVNNLRGPAQLFENRLCPMGGSLEIELIWNGSANTKAIGAQLLLQSGVGTLRRDLRVGSGYLSGDPPRVHIGVPADTVLDSLEIIWPDGERTILDELQQGVLITVVRGAAMSKSNKD